MLLAAGTPESLALCLTAAATGVVHTLLGPDHYVPFVVMSRAGDWSLGKTLRVTAAYGLAHVTGSVAIGLAGLALGLAVMRLEHLEALRGDVAAWLMIGFGLASMTWGLVRAPESCGVPHDRMHVLSDGTVHAHSHTRDAAHLHVHAGKSAAAAELQPARSQGSARSTRAP